MSIVDRPSSTSPATTPTNQGVRKHRDANEHKFLSFCLGTETYGVEILKVREIIGLLAITPLPQTPPYVRGVMNLRGRIIPVIDLRLRFALPAVEATKETCVIVLESTDSEGEQTVMGAVVDSVREVQYSTVCDRATARVRMRDSSRLHPGHGQGEGQSHSLARDR